MKTIMEKIEMFLTRYYKDHGLLIIRIGIGVMFMFHGYPKIAGGPQFWEKLGMTMGYLGLGFWPTFWGFMSGFAEFFGGVALILGLFFRPITIMMLINMIVATTMHFSTGEGMMAASHAIEDGIMFLGLAIVGPGKYAIDEKLIPLLKCETAKLLKAGAVPVDSGS